MAGKWKRVDAGEWDVSPPGEGTIVSLGFSEGKPLVFVVHDDWRDSSSFEKRVKAIIAALNKAEVKP
jgi:hypothetical protein